MTFSVTHERRKGKCVLIVFVIVFQIFVFHIVVLYVFYFYGIYKTTATYEQVFLFTYVYETREMERSMRLSAHGLVVRLYSIYALQVDPSSASNTVDK